VNSAITVDFRVADQQVEGLVFTCCKLGFENNPEKLEEEGFAHMQKQGGTCMHHVRNISAGVCEILPGVQD